MLENDIVCSGVGICLFCCLSVYRVNPNFHCQHSTEPTIIFLTCVQGNSRIQFQCLCEVFGHPVHFRPMQEGFVFVFCCRIVIHFHNIFSTIIEKAHQIITDICLVDNIHMWIQTLVASLEEIATVYWTIFVARKKLQLFCGGIFEQRCEPCSETVSKLLQLLFTNWSQILVIFIN